MVKITPKQLIVTLIIVLLSGTGYVVNDKLVGGDQFSAEQIAFMIAEGNWFYCELENSLKQCSELTKYAVENAKCIMLNGKGDICTKDGVRHSWNDFSDYIGVKLSDPFIEVLQLETVHFYNRTVWINYSCWEPVNNSWNTCYNESFRTLNYSTFEPVGYNINYSGKTYEVRGVCCGFYNESPYKEFLGLPVISCKEKIGGICNPLIQQTSKDFSEYDEFGRIYVIHKDYLEPKRVGSYEYVNNYDKNPSKLKVFKKPVVFYDS